MTKSKNRQSRLPNEIASNPAIAMVYGGVAGNDDALTITPQAAVLPDDVIPLTNDEQIRISTSLAARHQEASATPAT